MKTYSRALVWELWRKNRWGLLLVALLLAICAAGAAAVHQLDLTANRCRDQLNESLSGSTSLADLFPKSANGQVLPATGRVKLGNRILYEGPFSPTDRLSWSGAERDLDSLGLPFMPVNTVQLFLNEHQVTQPLPVQPQLTISLTDGGKRTISFAAAFDLSNRLSDAILRAAGWRQTVYFTSVVAIAFSILAVLAIFGAAEPSSTRGFTGIPPRQFALPVPTAALVLWPVLLGAATMLIVSFLWFGCVLPAVRTSPLPLPTLYFMALFTSALALFQALVWGLPSFPKTRVTALTALMLVVVVFAALPFDLSDPGQLPQWNRFELGVEIACLLSGAVAASLAGVGVQLERNGRWASRARSSRWRAVLSGLGPRPVAFSSALQAQVWMEWKRNGRIALILWVALAAVILVTNVWLRVLLPEWRWLSDGLLTAASVLAVFWVAVIGLNLGRDGATKRLRMGSFVASRPLSSGQLFEAKMLVGGFVWLAAAMILVVTWLLSTSQLEQFSDASLGIVALLAVSLNVAVGVLPLCLSGRIPGFPWSLLPLLVLYGSIVNGFLWFDRHPDALDWLFPILLGLLGVKLACAFWAFQVGWRRRITSGLFVLGYTAFWIAAAGGLIWVAGTFMNQANAGSASIAFIPAAALVVPLARVAASPLALARNRHR